MGRPPWVRVWAAFCAGIGLFFWVCRAAAASGAELRVEIAGCQDVEQTALGSLLAIELATLKVAPQGWTLSVSCRETRATLQLTAPDGAASESLDVELGAVDAGARTRLVALTASELIAKVQPRADSAQPRPKPPAPKVVAAAATDDESARVSRSAPLSSRKEWSAGVTLRRGGSPGTTLVGVSLGGEHWLAPALSVAGELRGERGRTQTPLSSIDWTPLTAALFVLVGGGSGALHLRAGPGVRAGVLWLNAHADPPNTGRALSAGWLMGSLRAGLSVDVQRHLAIFAGFEAGYVAWPVHGQIQGGAALVDANGAWLGGALGAALVL